MRITADVEVNLSKFPKIIGLTKSDSKRVIAWAKRSARLYRKQLQQRFDRFSRGGGHWKETIARKTGKNKFILRDTHTLFKALTPVFKNYPGQLERFDGRNLVVGYGGPAIHPTAKPLTVAQLASIHNTGTKIIPRRQIVVRPTSDTRSKMTEDLQKTVSRIGKEVDSA